MPKPVPGGRWQRIDDVAVDSGQIEIIDPAMRSGDSVVFQSGLGDGIYEVWGRKVDIEEDEDGEGDWRWAEIRIVLITQEDLDRWNAE